MRGGTRPATGARCHVSIAFSATTSLVARTALGTRRVYLGNDARSGEPCSVSCRVAAYNPAAYAARLASYPAAYAARLASPPEVQQQLNPEPFCYRRRLIPCKIRGVPISATTRRAGFAWEESAVRRLLILGLPLLALVASVAI